jgi:hypothetical protein
MIEGYAWLCGTVVVRLGMGTDIALKKLYIALHVTDREAIAVGWSEKLILRRISVGMFVIW